MKIVFSVDDGHILDLKLAKLFKKYNISAIFYIPTVCELSEDDIKSLDNDGFTIGCHTTTHPSDLKRLTDNEQEDEIYANKVFLETLISKEIKTFCYPKGRYNDKTVEILKKLGFDEARTTVTGNIDFPNDPYRIKTSVHVYPETPRFNKPNWFKEGCRLFDEAKNNDGYFSIWMHSWELSKFNLWEELETFLKYIKENR